MQKKPQNLADLCNCRSNQASGVPKHHPAGGWVEITFYGPGSSSPAWPAWPGWLGPLARWLGPWLSLVALAGSQAPWVPFLVPFLDTLFSRCLTQLWVNLSVLVDAFFRSSTRLCQNTVFEGRPK